MGWPLMNLSVNRSPVGFSYREQCGWDAWLGTGRRLCSGFAEPPLIFELVTLFIRRGSTN